MANETSTPDYAGFAKRAFEPATRLNEVLAGNVERVARFQYAFAGDLLQLGLDQLDATVKAKDLTTLFAKQREIAIRFAEKAQGHQQALADLATESQAGFTRWVEDTAELVTGKTA